MPPVAIGLVLASAILHVGWNALVKTSGDPLRTATRAVWLGVLVATPFVAAGWLVSGRPGLAPLGWVIAFVSGGVEVLYYVALARAYRHGELSAVYPVARGSGALFGVIAGIGLLGERLAPLGLLGVALLLTGIISTARSGARRAALVPALATGLTIASYSALDRLGVQTGPPWLYSWAIFAFNALWFVAWRVAIRGAERRHPGGEAEGSAPADVGDGGGLGRPLATGVLIMVTYTLVLLALQVAPLAGVAPLRESATVLAAAWGVIALRERGGAAWRVGGAIAVALGAGCLALAG